MHILDLQKLTENEIMVYTKRENCSDFVYVGPVMSSFC